MRKQIKNLLVSVLAVLLFFTSGITTQAYSFNSYNYNDGTYEYIYYRTPYYYDYETKDLSTFLDLYANGELDKNTLVKKLIMQCDDCNFYYNEDETTIECYNDNECKYVIYLYEDVVQVDFYDAKYNGKHMTKLSCNGIISSEKEKCKKKNRKYDIYEDSYNEMATINMKGILINNTRSITCLTSGSFKDAPGIISLLMK